jgi:hypothetical protein
MWEFYQIRGFTFPGFPGAVDPLLAQHGWIHCLADYDSSATGEIEVFTFLAFAIPDSKGFLMPSSSSDRTRLVSVAAVPGVATAKPGYLSEPGDYAAC